MSWHRKLPNQAACGSCCGIKEKLQTLWDRTINSILKINQVEPDDQGNIRIRSDNEALTVTEGTNEIVLNLDTSELPAASVVSVNGETGAVQLSGDDIPSLYNGTVNSNIAGLWSTKAQQSALNTEINNRQNADTALQNNINTLQASIPQEAADAVAADPTVQSFAAAAADIPNKVDKRTGSGLRAYTHDGSTQDDTPVIDGTTGTTIPIRDSDGRLQAADPAAGATDKTLTTANWVSQTGDSAPNNLLHKSGNETKNGSLKLNAGIMAYPAEWHGTSKTGMNIGDYCIFAEIETNYNGRYLILDFLQNSNTATAYGRFVLRCNRDIPLPLWAFRKTNGSNNPLSATAIHVLSDGSKMYLAWRKEAAYGGVSCCEIMDFSYANVQNYNSSNITWYATNDRIVTNDISGYTDHAVIE